MGLVLPPPLHSLTHLLYIYPRPPQARAAQALDIPIIVTEQYPKALGATVAELVEVLPQAAHTVPVPKTVFSMLVPEVEAHLAALPGVKKVMIVGIEAHVCVLQTTLDLIERGYEVHILVDGVSSQRLADRSVALQRLAQAGAFLATSGESEGVGQGRKAGRIESSSCFWERMPWSEAAEGSSFLTGNIYRASLFTCRDGAVPADG